MANDVALQAIEHNMRVFEDRARGLSESLEVLRALRRGSGTPVVIAPMPSLSSRELAILRLIADGRDNEEIAKTLHFGLGTIKLHVRKILEKLGVPTRTAAAVRAVRLGLI
jgi:DNA-binding NarL/FixJ family response regulator